MESLEITNVINGMTMRSLEILRDIQRQQKGNSSPVRYGRGDAALAAACSPGQGRAPLDALTKLGLVVRQGGNRKLAALTSITEKGQAVLAEMCRRWGVVHGSSQTEVASTATTAVPPSSPQPRCRSLEDVRDVPLRRAISAAGPIVEREVRTAMEEGRELDRGILMTALSHKDVDALAAAISKHYQPRSSMLGGLASLMSRVIGGGDRVGGSDSEVTCVPIPQPAHPIRLSGVFAFDETQADGATRRREVDAAGLEQVVNSLKGEAERVGYRLSLATAAQVTFDVIFGRGAELGSTTKRIRCAMRLVKEGRWNAPKGYSSSFSAGLRSVMVTS